MVVILIIAVAKGMRMLTDQRTPRAAPGTQQSRPRTKWIPPLLNYPVRASR